MDETNFKQKYISSLEMLEKRLRETLDEERPLFEMATALKDCFLQNYLCGHLKILNDIYKTYQYFLN